MPEFDRFDVVEAWYIFLSQWHDGHGRGRASYGRLSRLLQYFRPAPSLTNEDDLSENGRLIYDRLVSRVSTGLVARVGSE